MMGYVTPHDHCAVHLNRTFDDMFQRKNKVLDAFLLKLQGASIIFVIQEN